MREIIKLKDFGAPKGRKRSKEGVTLGKDGSMIYDDSWLHADVLEEDERKDNEEKTMIAEIAKAWITATHPVVFTGAGMSTESGLPDFRSAQGLWKVRPESLATLEALATQPDEFYHFYQWRIAKLWEVSPNPGHQVVSDLQRMGYIQRIITQNVDGLHQRSGSEQVIEVHGSLRTVRCIDCHSVYDSRSIVPTRPDWEAEYRQGRYHYGAECHCSVCNGLLRPNVVLFGESLPETALAKAMQSSKAADFFVVLGSSLAVSPANYFPAWAVENGAKLLIINNEPTHLDNEATWVIHGQIGKVLHEIFGKMSQR